jgi:hypothetical protein
LLSNKLQKFSGMYHLKELHLKVTILSPTERNLLGLNSSLKTLLRWESKDLKLYSVL